jgi:succinate dehydrogenase / fumarate reductase cytochrome b subunit
MRLGMYAWVIQRVSGLYMVLFLFAHITAIAQANFGLTGSSIAMFDTLRNPFWAGGAATITFDLATLVIIAFHGLNGIRIVFLDLGFGVRKHRLAFWFTMALVIAVTAFIIALALPMLSLR